MIRIQENDEILKTEITWEELEKVEPNYVGLEITRYSPETLPKVYIALKFPEKLRAIAIKINKDLLVDLSSYNKIKGCEN